MLGIIRRLLPESDRTKNPIDPSLSFNGHHVVLNSSQIATLAKSFPLARKVLLSASTNAGSSEPHDGGLMPAPFSTPLPDSTQLLETKSAS
jgi:hypothetical protein